MGWEEILKTSTLEVKLKHMVKDGDYSDSKMAWAYKRMCKAGKDHISEGLNGINLDKDLMYSAIGYALDAYAYVRLDDESRIPEFADESSQIYKLLQEGLEICKKAKRTLDEKIRLEEKNRHEKWNRPNYPNWREDETEAEYMERTGDFVW
tara:strand:- start:403 stop:855 length:453 start_codon:yes stop_codon:yes gene_type:complete